MMMLKISCSVEMMHEISFISLHDRIGSITTEVPVNFSSVHELIILTAQLLLCLLKLV